MSERLGDLRGLSREFLEEFIEIYKSNPCLWQVKSKDYSNKQKKGVAYEKLIEKLRELEPAANKESAIKKINSIRICFRKEYRKVLASEKSGAGATDIYVPTLWYYDLLLFLIEQDEPRPSISNIPTEEDRNEAQNKALDEYNTQHDAENEIISDEYESVLSPLGSSVTTTSSGYKTPSVKRPLKRTKKADNVLDIVAQKLQEPPDQLLKFDSFGKHVAEQMRSVNEKQGFYLSKIINDAIFEAQCGNLSKNSRIVTPPEVTVNNQPSARAGFTVNNQPSSSYLNNQSSSSYLIACNTLPELDNQCTNNSLADYFKRVTP